MKRNFASSATDPPPPGGEGLGVGGLHALRHCDHDIARAHAIAAAVVDPEIPVLTLEDLGVLRGVERRKGPHRR
jgi:hypothetical protein